MAVQVLRRIQVFQAALLTSVDFAPIHFVPGTGSCRITFRVPNLSLNVHKSLSETQNNTTCLTLSAWSTNVVADARRGCSAKGGECQRVSGSRYLISAQDVTHRSSTVTRATFVSPPALVVDHPSHQHPACSYTRRGHDIVFMSVVLQFWNEFETSQNYSYRS